MPSEGLRLFTLTVHVGRCVERRRPRRRGNLPQGEVGKLEGARTHWRGCGRLGGRGRRRSRLRLNFGLDDAAGGDDSDVGGVIDGDLVGLGKSLRLHDAPGELVDLEPLEERGLVAHGALPKAALAVGLEVRLEVKALQVPALVAAGGQRHSPER